MYERYRAGDWSPTAGTPSQGRFFSAPFWLPGREA
jgi:hypothetical protein